MATNSAKVYQDLNIEPLRGDNRIALESFLPYQLSVIGQPRHPRLGQVICGALRSDRAGMAHHDRVRTLSRGFRQ